MLVAQRDVTFFDHFGVWRPLLAWQFAHTQCRHTKVEAVSLQRIRVNCSYGIFSLPTTGKLQGAETYLAFIDLRQFNLFRLKAETKFRPSVWGIFCLLMTLLSQLIQLKTCSYWSTNSVRHVEISSRPSARRKLKSWHKVWILHHYHHLRVWIWDCAWVHLPGVYYHGQFAPRKWTQ